MRDRSEHAVAHERAFNANIRSHVARGDDPACGPRRVLRVRRAARRPAAALAAGDRRRRRRDGGELRGAGVRRAIGDGRRAGAPAVPAGDRRVAALRRVRRGEQAPCSRSSTRPRRSSSACRSTRRSSTSAGCRRSRDPAADRDAAARDGARAGRAADHGRHRDDEAAGEGRQRPRQARRAAARRRPSDELDFLHPLPVERLWGVGARHRAKLHARGIATVGDLALAGEAALVGLLGRASGGFLYNAAPQPRRAARCARAGGGARSARSARSGARARGCGGGARRRARRARRPRHAPHAAGALDRPHRRAAAALRGLRPRVALAHAAPRDGRHGAGAVDGARAAARPPSR